MGASDYRCGKCHTMFSWGDVFEHSALGAGGMGIIVYTCPVCGGREEYRVEDGKLGFGYVYAAGDAHFSVMEERAVAGLVVTGGGGGERGVTVEYEGRVWRFGQR